MSSKPKTIKIPGPDHPITIEHNRDRVVVKVAGRVVAETRDALTVREASYPPVHYIPRKDVDMALLERTDHELAYQIANVGKSIELPASPLATLVANCSNAGTAANAIEAIRSTMVHASVLVQAATLNAMEMPDLRHAVQGAAE